VSSEPPSDEPTRVLSQKPPNVEVPAVEAKPALTASVPAEPKPAESKPPEAKPAEAKPLSSEKPPAAKAASERPKAEKSAKPAASVPPKAPTPSNAPSHTRSAILPLGIATGVIAGLLLWLGSGTDEPMPMEPETAAQAPVDTPGVPAIHAVHEPKAEQPAATVTAAPETAPAEPAATASAEATAAPSAAAPLDAAPSASAEPTPTTSAAVSPEAAPPTPATPEGAASAADAAPPPAADSSEPVPSDEGLLEGPVTQVFMAPDCAELYRKGKRIGRSGVRVRVPEGKKRVFEVVCPGHNTRKLTLDGNRKEVTIGLRPLRR
jgi:hypothetical protein